MPFSRNTIFTISLFALSSLFTWISKANYFSEMFLENNTCFCPQGNWASQKKKEKTKRNVFSGRHTTHLAIPTSGSLYLPIKYQASSTDHSHNGFHLNQYALFINIKLLRRISSKSLLKLTFHISKWVIHILSTVNLESQQASGFGSVGITKETDYSPTYLAINSHLLFLLSFIQIMWLFSRCALCVKKKKNVFGLELYKMTLFPAVWQVRCPEWLSQ